MTRPLVIVTDPDLDDGALAVVNRGGWTYNVHTITRRNRTHLGLADAIEIGSALECFTVIPADGSATTPPADAVLHALDILETITAELAEHLEEEPTT
jgi:hypothetical protein